jgi:MFS family permease
VSATALYRVALAVMFVFGIVLALPGTVVGLPDVAERLGLTLANRGALISVTFVGLLVGSFISGPIVDRIGHRASLSISAALIAVCLPLFALAPSYTLAAIALAAIGLASAGVNTASNALASDFFPEERGRRANGIAIAVGVGGLALPSATALFAGVVSWSWIVGAGALIAAACAVTVLRVAVPPAAAHAGGDAMSLATVLKQPGMVWLGLLVMLAAGTEASMAGFTSTYLVTLGFAPGAATWALSFHWVGLIVGRIALARRVDRGKGRAIIVAAAAGAAGIVLFVTASAAAILAVAPFLVGVAIAIIMPTSLALGAEFYPRNAGTLFGILLTVAQSGAIALPAIIGLVAESGGVRMAMSILALNNLLVAAICLRATRIGR